MLRTKILIVNLNDITKRKEKRWICIIPVVFTIPLMIVKAVHAVGIMIRIQGVTYAIRHRHHRRVTIPF